MTELVGRTVAGYKLTESLHEGAWSVFRALGPTGAKAIATVTLPPTPPATIAQLALPFAGIPRLVATEPIELFGGVGLAVIEDEPPGWTIADLKWPLPIAEVITVGLDLARVLERLHAAGTFHGALRPQTTWIHTIEGRCSLAGTTPRPELAGLHCLASRSSGSITPFHADVFLDDTLAKAAPRGVTSDIGQLGMMLYRMAMRRSPFAAESPMEQLGLALRGEAPPWPAADDRARAVEDLARAAFDPARASQRSLAKIVDRLEQLSK